jgi:hypothetical protein
LSRNGPDVDAEVASITVATSSIAGRRPREWDSELLQRALALDPETSRGALARLLAHLHALDRGDLEAARMHLAAALDHRHAVGRLWSPALLLQAALFSALHDRDAEAARRWYEEAGAGTMIPRYVRLFTEAAVHHVEGRGGVEERLSQAEAGLPDALDRGGAMLVADQIAALREERRNQPQGTDRSSASFAE